DQGEGQADPYCEGENCREGEGQDHYQGTAAPALTRAGKENPCCTGSISVLVLAPPRHCWPWAAPSVSQRRRRRPPRLWKSCSPRSARRPRRPTEGSATTWR